MEDMTTATPPQPVQVVAMPRTSGLAIASLVLGVLAIFTCGITSLVGLILGVVALCSITGSEEPVEGRGMAVAGIITSAVGMVLSLAICVAIMLPALARARQVAGEVVSMSNARQLATAILIYADDNDEQLPDPERWFELIDEYVGDQPHVMTALSDRKAGRMWAMNEALAGLKTSEIRSPADTVLVFECEVGSPPSGGPELLSEVSRHYNGHIVLFLDGHVEAVEPYRIEELNWEP